MARARIIGRRRFLEAVLERLHELRLLQLSHASDELELDLVPLPGMGERAERAAGLRLLLAELAGLLELAGLTAAGGSPGTVDAAGVRDELRELAPRVEALAGRIDELRTELAVLPRYLEPLRQLLPLVPELAELDEDQLRALHLDTIALVLNTGDARVLDTLRDALHELLGDRFELVAAQVDTDATGCVIILPQHQSGAVRTLLGRERVRQMPLPTAFERLSFRGAVQGMERRLRELPQELTRARRDLHELLAPRAEAWRAAHGALTAELEQVEAVEYAAGTGRAFVVVGWVPCAQLARLRGELDRAAQGEVVVDEVALATDAEPPVLLENRPLARPFEFLVRFLDLPRTGTLDPTPLMSLFLPLMVGAMVGDIVYGVLLLAGSLYVRRRFASGSAAVRDLTSIFVAGSLWAIVFGFLFGEALGDVGHRSGLPALWFYRGGADAVKPLLVFSLALGAAHVVLGMLLGIWQSARARRSGELVERAGSLLALVGVFGLAGIGADRLPGAALVPAAAAIAVGLVALVVPRGALGLIMGPLEFVGTLGNVLSYLRVGAVGLASTYLAMIANQLGGLGPLWLGLAVAAVFHALNLGLAAFSPMIQALRLHYVEFFSKFYEAGGQPFRPFGGRVVDERARTT